LPLQVRGVGPLEETEEVMFTSTALNVGPDAGMWCTRAGWIVRDRSRLLLFLAG
jgi:hypothetical protein